MEPQLRGGAQTDRAAAEARVRNAEKILSGLVRSASPEELVPELARRARQTALAPSLMAVYSPIVLVHAIEACCAYWQPWGYEPLSENRVAEILNAARECCFEDPAMSFSLTSSPDWFDFLVYMHRTQFEKQGSLWWMPIGRCARMFGIPGAAPFCEAEMLDRFGIRLQDWFRMALALNGAIANQKIGVPHAYIKALSELGICRANVERFFCEVSSTPAEIGQKHIELRNPITHDAGDTPLLWMQRRPSLSLAPLIRLARGFVAPVEAYLADLFDSSLIERLVARDEPTVRNEIGKRYERYIEECVRHFLPDASVLT